MDSLFVNGSDLPSVQSTITAKLQQDNRLAQALYAPLFADRTRAANDARFHFASVTGSRLRRTEPRRAEVPAQ